MALINEELQDIISKLSPEEIVLILILEINKQLPENGKHQYIMQLQIIFIEIYQEKRKIFK